MTLRDKVRMESPNSIDRDVNGGVFGCPVDYDFLRCSDCAANCDGESAENCKKCWDREFIPPAGERSATYKHDDGLLIELPCKVGDTVYAVDIVTQRQGRSKTEIAVAVEFTVDHFEIGQANIPFAIACNKDNVWTHLKPSEIYDKTTAEAIAKVINEIRRDANAAH